MGSLNLSLCWETFYKDREPVIFLSEVWTQYVNIPLCVLSAYNLTCLLVLRWIINLEVFVCTYRLLSPVVWGPKNDHDCTLAVQSSLSLPATVESTELAINWMPSPTTWILVDFYHVVPGVQCWESASCPVVEFFTWGWGVIHFFISSFLHTWFHSSTLRSFQIASSNIIFVAEETYVKRQHFRPSRKKRTYHLFWPPKKIPIVKGAMCIRNIWNPIV